MTWAEDKIRECVTILREGTYFALEDETRAGSKVNGSDLDALDLAEHSAWSEDPALRDCRGYLEAWADVADMTVGEFIAFVEGGRRFNLMLEEATR